MSLTRIDYLVRTNEDWLDSITLTEGEEETPVDIVGTEFEAHIRKSADDLSYVLRASTENGRLVIADPDTSGEGEGTLSWNIGAETMRTIEPGEYVYDLVWTNQSGIVDTIAAGTITVERGITRE